MSLRNRELLNVLVVGLLTGLGFASTLRVRSRRPGIPVPPDSGSAAATGETP